MHMNQINPVRPSPIAGSWYSSNADQLREEIEGYLSSATNPELNGQLVGLIAPHAGYLYSGKTAGYTYQTINGSTFDLCVVVSPLHAYLPYALLTTAHKVYATPLGQVEVEHELLTELNLRMEGANLPTAQPLANDKEHSLEIQLPFLQTALVKPFRLLPLMVRSSDPGYLSKTASILADLIRGKKVLLVASTDLSHFNDEATAVALDQVMLKRMTDFSPEGVLQAEANQQGFACGSGAVALVLWTAKALGANQVTLLNHSTSARASKDTSSVVGYGALAITQQEAV
ncbi:MAG TPA: AmmeMemoRadiSam system protein B [Anaerolineaceae bacterium]|nr:AmmeMemoRadiSam system protein B [Anaerolineaceae bacterium]